MSSGQDRLSIATLSLQRLRDDSDLVSYISVFVDFGLKLLKDTLIDHGRVGCHCDL